MSGDRQGTSVSSRHTPAAHEACEHWRQNLLVCYRQHLHFICVSEVKAVLDPEGDWCPCPVERSY